MDGFIFSRTVLNHGHNTLPTTPGRRCILVVGLSRSLWILRLPGGPYLPTGIVLQRPNGSRRTKDPRSSSALPTLDGRGHRLYSRADLARCAFADGPAPPFSPDAHFSPGGTLRRCKAPCWLRMPACGGLGRRCVAGSVVRYGRRTRAEWLHGPLGWLSPEATGRILRSLGPLFAWPLDERGGAWEPRERPDVCVLGWGLMQCLSIEAVHARAKSLQIRTDNSLVTSPSFISKSEAVQSRCLLKLSRSLLPRRTLCLPRRWRRRRLLPRRQCPVPTTMVSKR